jgi:large conductance mechanosensitive channel
MVKKFKKAAEGFKNFAFKDAVLGTAVGIMLGSALKDVITSLIDNILMPPIAYITSGIDFSKLFLVIGMEKYDSLETAQQAGALVLTYGQFINSFISFIILALVLYILTTVVIKKFKKDEKKKEEKKTTKECPYCFTTIDIKATRCPNCTSKLED